MTYYGITIGPIYKTLQYARKTRELWAASYLFSYLMKQIIKEVNHKGGKFLLPYVGEIEIGGDKVDLLNSTYESGLFPDRCIFSFDSHVDFDEISTIINSVSGRICNDIIQHLKQRGGKIDEKEASEFLNNYFQVYMVERSFEHDTPKREITSPLFNTLDILELNTKLVPVERQNYLQKFLTTASFKHGGHLSFLIKDSTKSNERVRFSSIIEIAAKELTDRFNDSENKEWGDKTDVDSPDEEDIVSFLKIKEGFKTYHKYVAIVQIDGDGFGALNKTLDDEDFLLFSKCLASFSILTSEAIVGYGGLPVYIGGDDALFFAPVSNGGRHIFQLIDAIDKVFQNQFHILIEKEKNKENPIALSLSAGISITYYKYPLVEALETSGEQLFDQAKKFQSNEGVKKNAVSVRILKHSGQELSAIFQKGSYGKGATSYDLFKELVTEGIEDGRFFSSLIQSMSRNSPLLEIIAENEDRISDFIDNNFNEPIHQTAEAKEFLNKVKQLIFTIHQDYPSSEEQRKKALYGSLRMVKFLNREDNE